MATPIENFLTLREASRLLPGRPHRATVMRWATCGLPTPSGGRAYLRLRKLGRRWIIDPADLERFVAEASGEIPEQQPQGREAAHA